MDLAGAAEEVWMWVLLVEVMDVIADLKWGGTYTGASPLDLTEEGRGYLIGA